MVSRFLFLLLACSSVLAADVAGVKIPDDDQKLVLNGAGMRKRAFFDVYVIGLYLSEKKSAAADAIGASGPKRVLIHMMRDVDADQFSGALTDGMKDNLSEAEMKGFEPRIRQLSAIMAGLKEAKKGMRITLDWTPAGTLVTVDGKPTGLPISGEDFYQALLKIWLGERPVQGDLKRALLGQKG